MATSTHPIAQTKSAIRKIGIELQSTGAWCAYFQRQIIRIGGRAFAVTSKINEAEDSIDKLNNLRLTLTSLLSFVQSLKSTTATTFYCRQPILRQELMVYNARIQDLALKLGLLRVIDVQQQNLQSVQDTEDAQTDEKKIVAYVSANIGAVKKEIQGYSTHTAREALSTLLGRQGINGTEKESQTLLEAIRILRGIVGSSPEIRLEHDFPTGPSQHAAPILPHPSPRPRHVSFDSLPRVIPIGRGQHPPQRTPTTPLRSPPTKATSPLSPRMPVREGSGIFICLRYLTPSGAHATFEPFGHKWGWADPVVSTVATLPSSVPVQAGAIMVVVASFRNWNSALNHAQDLGFVKKSQLQFLPGRIGNQILVLALFKIRGVFWIAGVENGKPGLLPLECLGPEGRSPITQGMEKVVSKPLHEHARAFLASRMVEQGRARPIKGVVCTKAISYFDSEIADQVGFFHQLSEVKAHKGTRGRVLVEGVGVFEDVPTVLFEENGAIHEFLFQDKEQQIAFFSDVQRMQLRGQMF